MHTDDTTDEAHGLRRLPAVAPGVPARSGTGAAEASTPSVRCPTGASTSPRRSCSSETFLGAPRSVRAGRASRRRTRSSCGPPTARSACPPADASTRGSRARPTAMARWRPKLSHRRLGRGLRHLRPVARGQPARPRAYLLRRASSARSAAPPATRCSSCCTATSTGSGRNGSGSSAGSTATQATTFCVPGSATSPGRRASGTTHSTPCGRGTT